MHLAILRASLVSHCLLGYDIAHEPSSFGPDSVTQSSCRVTASRGKEVRLSNGDIASVQPDAVGWRGSQLIVLGGGGVRFKMANDSVRPISRIAGVVVPQAGSAVPVALPIGPSSFVWPRLLGTAQGQWDVIFADTIRHVTGELVTRLWHGQIRHGSWARIDSITSLVGFVDLESYSSPLRRTSEGKLAFLVVQNPQPARKGVLHLFTGHGKDWRVEEIPFTGVATYPDMVMQPSGWVAVVDLVGPGVPTGLYFFSGSQTPPRPRLVQSRSDFAVRGVLIPKASSPSLFWTKKYSQMGDSVEIWTVAMTEAPIPPEPMLLWQGPADVFTPPVFQVIGDVDVLVLARDKEEPENVRVFAASSPVKSIGQVSTRRDAFRVAWASTGSGLLLVQEVIQGRAPFLHPALIVTPVAVMCGTDNGRPSVPGRSRP